MDAKKNIATLALILLSSQAQSFQFNQSHLIFQAGWFFSHEGKSQNINIQDIRGDRYTVNQGNGNHFLFGLGYLIEGTDNELLRMDYGIDAFYLANTSVKGSIFQEHVFENLAYRYHISHLPIYAVAKATIKNCSTKYALTLDVGVGPNFNKTSQLREWPINGSTAIPESPYSGESHTTFSATVGVGVKINNVFREVPIECGYRFFYLGEGSFRKDNKVWLNTLQTGQNYAQALLCSVAF